MISIFDFSDYRVFLRQWIEDRGDKARGSQGQLAKACGVSSTMMSLILRGEKNLSIEQTAELADFLGLNDRESDYLFLLVDLGRAGTFKLQQRLKKRIHEHQQQARKISNRIKKDIELSDEIKAIYYSSWIYTGIRNLTALEEFHDVASIAERLHLPTTVVNKALEFLFEHGLCRHDGRRITYGPAIVHVSADSPFVIKHHQNWRLRGFNQMDLASESNLYFTGPMSLSQEAAEEVRRLLPNFIDQIMKIAGPSKSEKVHCLNIDWFEF